MPKVVVWQRVYCAAMALLYLACIVGGVLLLVFQRQIAEADRSGDGRVVALIYGVMLTAIGFVLFAAFAAALFLPPKPWVWIYHIVLISIGLTSPCCMPASIPLLIFWIRPETRTYFGRPPA
jgi:hypothetical protein